MNKKQFYTDPIIVIIATSMERTNLLIERALKSVYDNINVNPHQIYIVDDNKRNGQHSLEYFKIKKYVRELREDFLRPKFEEYKKQFNLHNLRFENFFHTTVIENERTKGFSGTGAWNTAAFKALQYSKRRYFLAFLDDDDEWRPNYLSSMLRAVSQSMSVTINGKLKRAKIIAAVCGILRVEKHRKVKIQPLENKFTKEMFFVGNPGLQASNLFIELETFWKIGGFDESLKSTTDRDLGIRLCEYMETNPTKKIAFVQDYLVIHYANSSESVTRNLDNKKLGLDVFYRKYFHQFPTNLQEKSLERAKSLFKYERPLKGNMVCKYQLYNKSDIVVRDLSEEANNSQPKPFNLIIGTISDNREALIEQLKSFCELYNRYGRWLRNYRFLILENTDDEYMIRPIVNYFKVEKKLKVDLLRNTKSRASIAENRTYLQTKIYEIGKQLFNDNYIAWIVDDDLLFKCDTSNGTIIPNYFKYIHKLLENRIDAALGLVSGAPPIPFLSTLRTQLIDYYYNLTYFAHSNPEDKFKLNDFQNVNELFPEYYYDFSTQGYQHLEYPYYMQFFSEKSNKEAFKEFLEECILLRIGANVFRKVFFEAEEIGKDKGPSIYRGGNTIILNSELLKTPNYAPQQGNNRRSDFIWAIINTHIFNYRIHEVVLPLKHERRLKKTSLIEDIDKLKSDIVGYVFYRVLLQILNNDKIDTNNFKKLSSVYHNSVKDYILRRLRINFYRAITLLNLILNLLKDRSHWWYDSKYRKHFSHLIIENIIMLEYLKEEITYEKVNQIIRDLRYSLKFNKHSIDNIIQSIKDQNLLIKQYEESS